MESDVIIAKNAKDELERVVKNGQPSFSTERGDLFIAEEIDMAAIRLRIPLKDYFLFIADQPKALRPKATQLAPSDNKDFQIIIAAPIYIENKTTYVNGKEVVFI